MGDAMKNKKNYKYTLAAFDFDKTITKIDTLNDLLLLNFGYKKFILKMFLLSPLLVLYVLKLIPNYVAKQNLFSHFFRGYRDENFNKICTDYSLKRIDGIIKKEALNKIRWHKEKGHKVIIISASMENWIKPWAEKNSIDDVISTLPEIKDNILTGKFSGSNCYGEEKVKRFLEKYPDKNEYFLYAYGDSRGDRELLNLADEGFYRKFN